MGRAILAMEITSLKTPVCIAAESFPTWGVVMIPF